MREVSHDPLGGCRMAVAVIVERIKRNALTLDRIVGPDVRRATNPNQRQLAKGSAWYEGCHSHSITQLHADHATLKEEDRIPWIITGNDPLAGMIIQCVTDLCKLLEFGAGQTYKQFLLCESDFRHLGKPAITENDLVLGPFDCLVEIFE